MTDKTKAAIKAEFYKELEEKPMSKISVKSLVAACGINRNTFYYHFKDIPALMSEVLHDQLDTITKDYPNAENAGAAFQAAVKSCLSNKKAMLQIYSMEDRKIFDEYIWKVCDYCASKYKTAADCENNELLLRYKKCGLFGILSDWFERGMPENLIEDVLAYVAIRDISLK